MREASGLYVLRSRDRIPHFLQSGESPPGVERAMLMWKLDLHFPATLAYD